MKPKNLNPMRNKKPSKKEIELLTNSLRTAIEADREFIVIAELKDNALSAGSGRKTLIPFLVGCMMANRETADLVMNAAVNYVRAKIEDGLCKDCPGKDDCERLEDLCDMAKTDSTLKKELELLESLMQPGKN
jgi:hypothetical protein